MNLEAALNAHFLSELGGMRVAIVETIGGLDILGDLELDKEIRRDRVLIRECKGGFRYHSLPGSNPIDMGFVRSDRVVSLHYEN